MDNFNWRHMFGEDKVIINKKTLLEVGWVPVSEDLLQTRVIGIEILPKEGHLIKKSESCPRARYRLRGRMLQVI